MTDWSIHACAVQLCATADHARNLAQADRLVRSAAAAGAQLVLLPEKWNLLGGAATLRAGAEPLDGPSLAWAGALARELAIDLVAGSVMLEPGPTNTSTHFGPDGELCARYSKIHMFDVEVDGVHYLESGHTQAGSEPVATMVRGVRCAMSVCYDLRFPELYRALHAEVLLVPSAFTLATTREHWEVLLRARAIENQAWVLAANQTGEHAPGLRSGGHSMIIDPWGVVVAQAGDAPGLVHATLDGAQLQAVRRGLPALSHRRLGARP